MTFYPGDKIIYKITKRQYIVEKCYYFMFNNEKIELVDVGPAEKQKSDKFGPFKGYRAKYFKLVK